MLDLSIVVAWVAVQPWLSWPSLSADVSQRLTLVGLGVAAAFWATRRPSLAPLPHRFLLLALATLGVLVWQGLALLNDPTYFAFFIEAAALSNGVSVVAVSYLSVWALSQYAPRVWRVVRVVGVAFLVINLALAAWQVSHGRVCVGVLGVDRALAAWGVAWLPLCWVWHPGLAALPLALVVFSGKPLALLGVVAAMWRWLGRWRWHALLFVLLIICSGTAPQFALKVEQRALTWWHGWQAIGAHRWVGWGFSPMVLATVATHYGYVLPALHSDWLRFALGIGWPVTGFAAWVLWRTLREEPRTPGAAGLQGALAGLSALMAVQGTVSLARVGSLSLLVLAWYIAEQRQGASHA